MGETITSVDFESIYLETRQKENRMYSDEQVAQLPVIDQDHPHATEWQVRSRSAKRLIKYLEHKNKPLTILEVGCGNGWLSAKLAQIAAVRILGIDVNTTELEQARRVFSGIKNLEFISGDMNSIQQKFDVIIFAASIQYFPSLEITINSALKKLQAGGEIHIIDSMIYPLHEIDKAAHRSSAYYHSIGAMEMTGFYFHHADSSLENFQPHILFDPASFTNKLLGKRDPFPWICIKP